MLPRSSAKVRSGRSAASCARAAHRTGADARAGGERVERRADERVAWVGALGHRGEHQAVGRCDDGRSLAECTARSARPSSTACCTSFTNTPVPPIAWIGTSVRWSPRGRDDHQLDVAAEQRGDALRLPARQRAAARRHARAGAGISASGSATSSRSNSSASASA